MSYWQGVRYLVWNEYRNARWRNLTIVAFVIYLVAFTYNEFKAIILNDEFSIFLYEFLIIMMFSVAGLCISSVYGFGIKRDLITERFHYWRTLPIKPDQIVWARIITTTITSFVMIAMYYNLVAIAIMATSNIEIDFTAYALHGIALYAITYLFNMFYLFIEMCKSYKFYLQYCWIKPFAMLIIISSYTTVFKFSLVEKLYSEVQKSPWTIGIASLILLVATFYLAFIIIDKKFRQRNIM